MCFSANASLGAGVALTVIGVATIRKSTTPTHLVFASIPLIFAVQQIAEGFLWLTLPDPSQVTAQRWLTYVFLTFAQVIWPLLVPVAVMLLERDSQRRRIQEILVGIGAVVSIYLAYCLLTFHVQANIAGHHITYTQDYPMILRPIGGAFYFAATIIPLFVSRVKRIWILGLTIFSSYVIATLFYDHYVLSVWCFFASLISMSVYYVMVEIKNTEASSSQPFVHVNGGFAP
jgi:drug/metabolite transporter (DMT)-like permease